MKHITRSIKVVCLHKKAAVAEQNTLSCQKIKVSSSNDTAINSFLFNILKKFFKKQTKLK